MESPDSSVNIYLKKTLVDCKARSFWLTGRRTSIYVACKSTGLLLTGRRTSIYVACKARSFDW